MREHPTLIDEAEDILSPSIPDGISSGLITQMRYDKFRLSDLDCNAGQSVCRPSVLHIYGRRQAANLSVAAMKFPRERLEENFTASVGTVGHRVNLRQFLFVFPIQLDRNGANVIDSLGRR